MQITELKLQNFMSYKDAHVTFPTRGVVLITGANGHGKSALIEGIPAALWNETLRGTPWHNEGLRSTAHVILQSQDKVWEVIRTRSSKGTLKLKLKGDDRQFDSASKAKPVLNASVGSFNVWKRTHVFSSSDDAHFSRATDGQRKTFLETILGLGKFEDALKACRKDLRNQAGMLKGAQSSYDLLDTKAIYEGQRMHEAVRSRDSFEEPDKPEAKDKVSTWLESLGMDRDDLLLMQRGLNNDTAASRAEANQAEKRLRRLDRDSCPECDRPIPQEMRDDLKKHADDAYFKLEEVRKEAEKELVLVDSLLEELNEDISSARTASMKNTMALQNYEKLKKERDRQARIVDEAAKANAEYLRKRAVSRSEIDTHGGEVSILSACEKVLGLRGVRANVTARTLGGLQDIANHWLTRFTEGGMQLKINPFRELKSKKGAINDEWSMNLIGAGGGFGYDAASAGERQRIDIAMLFASAEVAQAALGMTNGTMFFDEVFDHLDKQGIRAVVEALDELAKDRAVVVISHSDAFVEAIRPAVHFHVQDGKVTNI